jgi:RNA polymerase sigma-70 factor (ECF subfamily)
MDARRRETALDSAAGESLDTVVLPHLDAAYRLARWLTGNQHDAEDVVQEACLRADRHFLTFSGGDGRAWFLRIVRNLCYSGRRPQPSMDLFDGHRHSGCREAANPATLALHAADTRLIERALEDLPDRFRELLVLRELEGLSYHELGVVLGIPTGTVMSGLSRARLAFSRALTRQLEPAGHPRASAAV